MYDWNSKKMKTLQTLAVLKAYNFIFAHDISFTTETALVWVIKFLIEFLERLIYLF